MAQADYIISNQTFPNTRADINNHLSAIATNNSGTSAPTTQYAGQFWIDTTTTTLTLYIHDGTDDIQFATIDTSANTVNFTDSALDVVTDTTPELGGNLNLNSNDITGTGNINITGTVTADGVSLGDNQYIQLGNSQDLRIYHDTTNSYVEDNGTGNLILSGANNVRMRPTGTGEDMLVANKDGSVELYHDNSKKLETTSTGATVTGNLSVTGNIYTSEGSETTPALQLNDPDTGLFDAGANAIGFTTNGSEKVRIVQGGSVGIGTTNPGQKLHVEGSIYTSGSLYVGGTGSANALDDYETGTFTPVLSDATSGGNTATVTGTTGGSYTKIGRLVTVTIIFTDIDTTGMTAGAGLRCQGLPFAANSDNIAGRSYNAVLVDTVNFTGYVMTEIAPNNTFLDFGDIRDSNADLSTKVSDILNSGSDIRFTFTYNSA